MKKHFSFIRLSWLWFSLSAAVILVGAASMVINQVRLGSPLALGIDFAGGSLMELDFEAESVDRQALEEAIHAAYPDSVSQITLNDQGSYMVQAKDMSQEQMLQVSESIRQKLGDFQLLRFNTIGPKIGATLRQKAIVALSIASIAIVLYIAYAFRTIPKRVSPWRFGFAAIAALLHDILITLGVFALLGYEIDALFITALLTIMGFSVHDTIVVFDRIRENLKGQTRDQTFSDIADISLRQTMARSINTSLSTLLPLLALYFWGSESIHHFVFALIVGIVVGTYSSVFIASPLLSLWQGRKELRQSIKPTA